MPPVISWRESLKKTLKEVSAEALVNFRIGIVWAMLGCQDSCSILFHKDGPYLVSQCCEQELMNVFPSKSFQDASATKSNFHLEAFSALVDLPSTTPLLQKIFASNDYFAAGCGGDVVLAGAMAT